MARHRNFHNLEYDDYDDYDEPGSFGALEYGQSPNTMGMYMYRRGSQNSGVNANEFFNLPSNSPRYSSNGVGESPRGSLARQRSGDSRGSSGGLVRQPSGPDDLGHAEDELFQMDGVEKESPRAVQPALPQPAYAPAPPDNELDMLKALRQLRMEERNKQVEEDRLAAAATAVLRGVQPHPPPTSERESKGGAKSPSAPVKGPIASPQYFMPSKLAIQKADLLEQAEENDETAKGKLNLVVIGHVDAGKSTLLGHLLYLQGRVDERTMRKFEKESKDLGKASFHFAWVLDQHEEERMRGVTVDVAVNYFETENKFVTLLDAPGHRDFIPNMICGAAQADAGILVVPATKGEFETGFHNDGQTKEHAILARSLGVNQLIVAINKLDKADWSEQRFRQIKAQLTPFLKQSSFNLDRVSWIPVSGLTGENILTCSEPKLAWYKGPTLVQLIDTLKNPRRAIEKPLRFPISDVFSTQTSKLTVGGRVETGCVMIKEKLLVMPLNVLVTVKAIEENAKAIGLARAGDNVEMSLVGADPDVIVVGQILCDPCAPVPMVSRFRAQIITLSYKVPLMPGTQCVLFTSTASESCHFSKLYSLINQGTLEVLQRRPRHLPKNISAEVEICTARPVCLELFKDFRELGRFSVRRGSETVAVGIVKKIYWD